MPEYKPEELHTRVVAHEPGIIILREVAAGNAASWDALTGRAKELGGQKQWGLLVDLTDVVERPNANYREALKESMRQIGATHVAFVQPGSVILRATLRFILGTFPGKNTVHKEMPEALDAIRATLAA